jgi:glycosyltransferase involved in cell wall biosynthesis
MVSVAIIAQDEEEVLPLTLECLVPIADILDVVVVVDGGSVDGTLEVVKSFDDRLPIQLLQHPFDTFSAQKNRALEHCRGRWVIGLDADMVFTSLRFRDMLLRGIFDHIPVWDWALWYARGDLRHYCTASTTKMPTTRLWKNIGLRYERDVHEYLVFPGETGWDSIHNPHRLRNTDQCAILEANMLKSDNGIRNRVDRYRKWADRSKEAGIGISGMSDAMESIIANRYLNVGSIPQFVLDGIPPKVFDYPIARGLCTSL